MADPRIKGGYYLKARIIQNSEIAHAPPHVREIWDWLLKEANHKDIKVAGKTIKRGQCLRSYKDIKNGLCWYVGWRKMTYSKHEIETAMKWLKNRTMITTTKTTRGMIITILNYNKFQNPKNYETYTETTTITTEVPHYKQECKCIKNILLPLSNGENFTVEVEQIQKWSSVYADINVFYELNKCREWNISNPKKQKTKSGIRKHLTTWLGKAQDRMIEKLKNDQPKTPKIGKAGDMSIYDN